MALTSSDAEPQPLGRIIMAMRDWVGRLGEVWVDAQVVEIKRRSGPTQFLTFRDRAADMSAQVTCSSMVLDAAGPIPEGSRVTARVKPRVFDRTTSLTLECLEIQVAGEGRLLAQLEQLRRKLQAEGLFDATASAASRSCRVSSDSSPGRTPTPNATWSPTSPDAGPPPGSGPDTPSSKAPTLPSR